MTRTPEKRTTIVARRHCPRQAQRVAASLAVVLSTVLLPPGPAVAAAPETCAKLPSLLWAVDDAAASRSDSARANKITVMRLSMRVMAALGSAEAAHQN